MDPYQSPDTQDPAILNAMIQRLEDRGENDLFNSFIDQYLETVNFEKTKAILDLGCGTGAVTRRIASKAPASTITTGVDISQTLLDVARKKSDDSIQWKHYEGKTLPFPDESMDLVILHTLLTHVPDPVETLKEAKRVLSPSGKIIIFDADYASTTYAINDFHKGREIDLKLLSAVVHNINVCRAMPTHISNAGLTLDDHTGHIIAEAGKGDFWLSSVQGFAKLIPALNILPTEEGEAWVNEILDHHKNGTFFASGNYYTYFVSKAD